MSIFRLFKAAVVLSIVLYFEGCGDKKKNGTNDLKKENSIASAEADSKIAELHAKVDQEIDQFVLNGESEDLWRAIGEDVKNEITVAVKAGKDDSEINDEYFLGYLFYKTEKKIEFWPKIWLTNAPTEDTFVSKYSLDPKNPDHIELAKGILKTTNDSFNTAATGGQSYEEAQKNIQSAVFSFIADFLIRKKFEKNGWSKDIAKMNAAVEEFKKDIEISKAKGKVLWIGIFEQILRDPKYNLNSEPVAV